MPRGRRWWVPGVGMHAISRFVDRRFYIVDDDDRRSYLDAIRKAQERWDWSWLSFALMSSHVHHGFIAGRVDPERFYRSAHTRFAARYHQRENRPTLGPVFASRPKFHSVRPGLLLRMVAYHHRNPVTAGVVDRAVDSTWTSHRMYMRMEPAPPWLDVEHALNMLGFSDTRAGRSEFDQCVMEIELEDSTWHEHQDEHEEVAIGTGGVDLNWDELLQLASGLVGVPVRETLASRGHRAAQARALVAQVAMNDFAQPYRVVAERFGMCVGSAANLLRRKQREPAFQSQLKELRRRFVVD